MHLRRKETWCIGRGGDSELHPGMWGPGPLPCTVRPGRALFFLQASFPHPCSEATTVSAAGTVKPGLEWPSCHSLPVTLGERGRGREGGWPSCLRAASVTVGASPRHAKKLEGRA